MIDFDEEFTATNWRAFWRMAVIKTLGALALILALAVAVLFFTIHNVKAAPIAVTTTGDVTVTLTDEPCAIAAVTNLGKRATWEEKGKRFEGCWGASQLGVVMVYFDDKTVGAIPAEVFRQVSGV